LQVERTRARRYSFRASIELTDLQSETQTGEQTSNLSLFGCHVDGGECLPTGTRVRVRIAHKSKIFEAVGRVANNQSNAGIGITFTKVEENDQAILEEWIAELRDKQKLPSH
jgi:PilZ domain